MLETRYFSLNRSVPFMICTALALLISFTHNAVLSPRSSIADDTGKIELHMTSDLPSVSETCATYSMEAATFSIYSDHQCTNYIEKITTNENGYGVSPDLPIGRFFVKQSKASPGFALSEHVYQADVSLGGTFSINAICTPAYSSPDTLLREVNSETGRALRVGGSMLESARFVISYYDNASNNATINGANRTWTFETDGSGTIRLSNDYLVEGSPLFIDAQGRAILPIGRYTAYMEKAPVGFLDDNATISGEVSAPAPDQIDPLLDFTPFTAQLEPIRGDLMFKLINENKKPMAGVVFLLSCINENNENIESHVIVTDSNGEFTTDAARFAHTKNCNANDNAVSEIPDGKYSLDETKIVGKCGIWFSEDEARNSSAPNDARGALPFGSYVLQELPCKANEGMNLSTSQFSIYKDAYTVALDNIVGTTPSIVSMAVDSKDSDKLIKPETDSVITDTIQFQNLIAGKSYKLTTTAIIQSSGEHMLDGNGATAITTTTFTPNAKSGRLQVQLAVDTSKFAGEKIEVCEQLVSEDGLIISQSNTESASHVLSIEPRILACAFDSADLDNYVMGTQAVITEKIDYEGLTPGNTYTLHAAVNDKATGASVRNAQGNVVEETLQFVPETSNGNTSVELSLDTTALTGHDLVVFDRMSDQEGKTIASHQDLENPEQTLKTVKLTTSASDKADGDKLFDARSQAVTIVDTVKYANLEVGKEYELQGALMDKVTGSALTIDGAPVKAKASFIPKEISGTIDMEYTFDASAQSSDVLVVFETLTHNGNVIAEHTDWEDVAQTMTCQETDPDAESANAALDANDNAHAFLDSSDSSLGKAVGTGDTFNQALAVAIVMAIIAALCVAVAAHRRRLKLDAIAKDLHNE